MKQQYRGYRDWVLDEWELHGTPQEWPAQLEELYRRQPVFAIVGGIADDDWSPIDAFCARHQIPAILPQTPLPPAVPAGDGFYSLYFSKGVTLEAQAIAHHLGGAPAAGGIRQVARCGTAGAAAAAVLRERRAGGPVRVPAGSDRRSPPTPGRRSRAARATLVVWLADGDTEGIEALAASPALETVREVYLSSSLLGEAAVRLPERLARRSVLAHPFVPPDEFERHATRSLLWMKGNGLEPADRRVAVDALFAAVLASDALSMPRTIDSREYFVEVIEHMTNRSVSPTAYPSVTFDPKRRFGSAGAYLLRLPSSPGRSFGKVEEWYVPGS